MHEEEHRGMRSCSLALLVLLGFAFLNPPPSHANKTQDGHGNSGGTHADPSQQGSPQSSTRHAQRGGVMCIMLRDQNRYVLEWTAFHVMLGAKLIVFYDDNPEEDSGEGLRNLLKPFVNETLVHGYNIFTEYGVTDRAGLHVHDTRQNFMIGHCSKHYGPLGAWLATLDVDEFIFPCQRPSSGGKKEVTLGRSLEHAVETNLKNSSSEAIRLECFKFGINDADKPIEEGELVIQKHVRRAPYPHIEPGSYSLIFANASKCTRTTCASLGSEKYLVRGAAFDPQRAAAAAALRGGGNSTFGRGGRVRLIVHNVEEYWWENKFVHGSKDRLLGVCCNHYSHRSTQEMLAKIRRNRNPYYLDLVRDPGVMGFYRSVYDTLIWQYLWDLKTFMKGRGIAIRAGEEVSAEMVAMTSKNER